VARSTSASLVAGRFSNVRARWRRAGLSLRSRLLAVGATISTAMLAGVQKLEAEHSASPSGAVDPAAIGREILRLLHARPESAGNHGQCFGAVCAFGGCVLPEMADTVAGACRW